MAQKCWVRLLTWKLTWDLLQAETREIVIERIALEEAQARAAQAAPRHDEGDINTDDDEDDPEEFSLWQSREMARIAR